MQPFVPSPGTSEEVAFSTELPWLTVSGKFLLFAVFNSSLLLKTSDIGPVFRTETRTMIV